MVVGAALLAGGRGRRMGGALPKQFLALLGKPILLWALEALLESGVADRTAVVVPGGFEEEARAVLGDGFPGVALVAGGRTRQESSLAALRHFGESIDIFLTHDAARPLVSPALFRRVVEAALRHGAAVAAHPASDTMKVADAEGFARETLPRERLWAVQTPQAFRRELIARGHEEALAQGFEGTDDAALVERLGHRVALVCAEPENIKVTTPVDLALAEALAERVLKRRRSRGEAG